VLNLLLFKLPWKSSKASKILHVSLLFVTSLAAYGLSSYAKRILPSSVMTGLNGEAAVYGFLVIFGVMLGAAVYHLLQGLALIGVNSSQSQRSIIQEGLWPVKVLLLAGCAWACMHISVARVMQLFYVALGGAAVSTLIQAFLLVDVAYEYAGYLVEKYEETYSKFYQYVLVGLTIFFNLVIVLGSVYMLIKYPSSGDRTVVVLNFLGAMLMTCFSATETVREANPQAGIFQSSLLGCYNLYLTVSAELSRPGNVTMASEKWAGTFATLGFFGAMFLVAFSAVRTGQASQKLLISKTDAEEEEGAEYNRTFFHFVFVLAALQLAVLMTRWKVPRIDTATEMVILEDLAVAYWVKVGTSWVIVGLYMWTLFAPILLPDREFI
jgi:hypothetical protein